jgi:hypothetical protein
MSQTRKLKLIPFYKTLFLDVILDSRTRPIFLYTLLMIIIGATVYHLLEGWSWLDSFYFVVITLTTIGYGDLAPTTSLTKLITIFYALNGVIVLLMLFDAARNVRGWYTSSVPTACAGYDNPDLTSKR